MAPTWRKRGLALILLVFATLLQPSAARADAVVPYRWLRIDGVPVRWTSDDGGSLVLKYAIASNQVHTPDAINCGRISPPSRLLDRSSIKAADFRRAAAQAFAVWQQQINITFVEVDDEASADIVLGEQTEPVARAFANVTIAKSTDGKSGRIIKAAICVNPQMKWKIGFDGNLSVYDLVHTIAHEIGHTIGLDHPGGHGHLMSFRYEELRDGLSAGDILGAVRLYGRRNPAVTTVHPDQHLDRAANQRRSAAR